MLGKNIKELRVEKGLSQAQLAKLVGVTQGAIYFWEKGINEPTAGYVKQLAKIFSISTDDLLSYESSGMNEKSPVINELFSTILRLSTEQQEILLKLAKEIEKNK